MKPRGPSVGRVTPAALANGAILLHLFYWLWNLPLAQLQLFLLGRRPVDMAAFAVAEAALLLLWLLWRLAGKIFLRQNLFYAAGALLLMLCGLAGAVLGRRPAAELLFFFYYWCMPFLLLFAALESPIPPAGALRLLLVTACANALMMLLQKALGSVLWPYAADEQGRPFFYISQGYYGEMARCPGLFLSGLAAGVCLLAGLVCLHGKVVPRRGARAAIRLLLFAGVLLTGTRNLWLVCAYIMLLIWLQRRVRPGWVFAAALLAPALYGLFLFWLGTSGRTGATGALLTDTLSIQIRVNIWRSWLADFARLSPGRMLFGRLSWQNGPGSLFTDNLLLDAVNACGLMGALLQLAMLLSLLRRSLGGQSGFARWSAAFLAGYLLLGAANAGGGLYPVCALLLNAYPGKEEEPLEDTLFAGRALPAPHRRL